jgi:hypothetical protein
MPQHILNVRVRPCNVAVLVAKTAADDDVMLALRFLSRLWGGRFCLFLAVEPDGNDHAACSRLSDFRPDLVYGLGIDHDAWRARVREACQSRRCAP